MRSGRLGFSMGYSRPINNFQKLITLFTNRTLTFLLRSYGQPSQTVANESEEDDISNASENDGLERRRPKTTIRHLRRSSRFKNRILTIKARSIMHRVFWLGGFYLLKVLMVARRRYSSRSMSSRSRMTRSTQ